MESLGLASSPCGQVRCLPSSPFLFIYSYFLYILLVAAQIPSPSPTHPSIIEQPIIHPTKEDQLTPGSTYTIQWIPDPAFSNVTIELWDKTSWGYSRDFGDLCYHWVNPFCGTIVSHAPNTGTFEWNVPKPGSDFPRDERVFWIKMYVDDYWRPDLGNTDPVLSYSQNFAFVLEPGQTPTRSNSQAAHQTSSMAMDMQPGDNHDHCPGMSRLLKIQTDRRVQRRRLPPQLAARLLHIVAHQPQRVKQWVRSYKRRFLHAYCYY